MDDEAKSKLRLWTMSLPGVCRWPLEPNEKTRGVYTVQAAVENGLTAKQLVDWFFGDATPEVAAKIVEKLGFPADGIHCDHAAKNVRAALWLAGYGSRDSRPQSIPKRREAWLSNSEKQFLSDLHELVAELQAQHHGENSKKIRPRLFRPSTGPVTGINDELPGHDRL